MADITTQTIQTGINDLLKRIQTEGITQGSNVLLAPQSLQTTPTGQINPVITADKLGGVSPDLIKVPPPPTPTSGTMAGATVAGATADAASIQKYIDLFTPKETPESKRVSDLITKYESDIEGLKGRGTAQLSAEEAQGVQQKKEALTAAEAQIAAKTAEFNKIEADYMKAVEATERVPGTTTGIVAGQQRQLARDLAIQRVAHAAEIGVLQAGQLALQGRYNDAVSAANRAVDLKYGDTKDEIEIRLKQIELIQGQLTKTEKVRADAIQAYLNDQKTAISTAQANEKDKNATLLNQMQKYPDAGITLQDTIQSANEKVVKNSKIYQKESAPVKATGTGDSVVDIRQQRNDTADLLAQVATYKSREQATTELENYKASIITRVGQEGFNQIQKEVDRKFPPPKEEPITEVKPSIFETVTGAVSGFFNRLFQK